MAILDLDQVTTDSVSLCGWRPDDFEFWLSQRPNWLQTAAASLLKLQGQLGTQEISNLAYLCTAEAMGSEITGFESIPPGIFEMPAVGQHLRIIRIEKLLGINALSDNSGLDLSDADLSIIFGANGAGKSGYARLLKHVCGARTKRELLHNVFSDKQPAQSADIVVRRDGTDEYLKWMATAGPLPVLQHAHIFDSDTAHNYANAKNESTYEPRRMRFISALVDICDSVRSELAARKSSLPSNLPKMPEHFSATPSWQWYRSLKATTSTTDVTARCTMTDSEKLEKLALETTLQQPDPQARLKELQQRGQRIARLRNEVQVILDGISDEHAAIIVKARLDAVNKRRAATEDADKVFQNAPLSGVGQASWRLLWEHARAYSLQTAYISQPFPYVSNDARCLLCQQNLGEEAKARLRSFEEFVRQGLEVDANKAEAELRDLMQKIPRIAPLQDWVDKYEFLQLEQSLLVNFVETVRARQTALDTAVDLEAISQLDVCKFVEAMQELVSTNEKEITMLMQSLQENKRNEFEKRLQELRAKEWLSQHHKSVLEEVARLKKIAQLEKAESLTRTNELTSKKNQLADQELATGYRDRFQHELDRLGGKRLRVDLLAIQEGKGKISFSVSLKGAKRKVSTPVVLSEGENRVVSLAAFLADVTGGDFATPFIFDDPISSLDQDFEERVVERLIDLAKERQVIVLTHRLSFKALLEEGVDRLKKAAKANNQQSPVKCRVNVLRRLGDIVGLVTDAAVHESKVDKALNKIKNESIPRIRKAIHGCDFDECNQLTKAVCSNFRILVERAVEEELINGVVKRFRRSVQTMDKLPSLAKITHQDCSLLDKLMTKYSCFEHSQASELPALLPEPDDIEEDVNALLTWVNDFRGRAAMK